MIYLASQSPRRRELLTQIGIEFSAMPVDIDESVYPNEPAQDYVLRMAKEKAEAADAQKRHDWPVLAADTIVVVDDEILLKPVDKADAIAILSKLSGRVHQVKTAIAVAYKGRIEAEVVTTDVYFRAISELDIEQYWQTGEPQDKAGSYGIQGIGGKFVKAINGSYSAVVGLPLVETEQLLNKMGQEQV